MEYKLSKELTDAWQNNGYTIKYTHNENDDFSVENKSSTIYFERYTPNHPYNAITNGVIKKEIAKLIYKTISYMDSLKEEENEEQTNATKVIWYDGDREIEEVIEEI